MARKTENELRSDIDNLKAETSKSTTVDWTVEWRDAAPEERPTGLAYDADEGLLAYDLWTAQREALDALDSGEYDIVAFLAGYGSGKSITGARWLIATALAYPGSRFLAMGQDFTKARNTTHGILRKQLPGERTGKLVTDYAGPEQSPIVADYDRQAHKLTLVNDSVIILGGADRWDRYAGAEFGAVWMDEPSHYGDDLYDLLEMIGGRLRGVDGPKTMCWTLTGNGYNAAWEILEKRQDVNGDPIGLNIKLVRASTLENPYLDDSEKERFKRQYADTGREEQALHGEFEAAQGLVYDNFQRDRHVIPHSEASDRVEDDWRIYGYDAGWNNPRVLLEIGKTSYDQLVVLDEFYERESHIKDAIEWLTSNDKPEGPIYAEHEPEDIEKFTRIGYQATQAEKSLDPGIEEVHKRLQPDGNLDVEESPGKQARVFDTVAWTRSSSGYSINTRRRRGIGSKESDTTDEPESCVGLLISEQCDHLIREFFSYKKDNVREPNAKDDCLDSLRYACMGVADR